MVFMSKAQKITLLVAVVVIVALLAVCGFTGGSMKEVSCIDCHGIGIVDFKACESCGGDGSIRGTLWALLPPVIAIGLALITKEVYSSLFVGVLAGALFGILIGVLYTFVF